MDGETEKTFKDDSITNIIDRSEELAEEKMQELQEKKSKETKTGRKSKVAKEAETEEVWIGIIQSVVTGVNTLLVKALGEEMNHEEEEIKTISVLGAPVANKYIDFEAVKYKDEAALLSYLFMCESPKIEAALKRKNKEIQERKKKQQSKKQDDAKE